MRVVLRIAHLLVCNLEQLVSKVLRRSGTDERFDSIARVIWPTMSVHGRRTEHGPDVDKARRDVVERNSRPLPVTKA